MWQNYVSKTIATDQSTYRTLDDVGLRQLAQSDLHNFVKYAGKMRIIDEIQRASARPMIYYLQLN